MSELVRGRWLLFALIVLAAPRALAQPASVRAQGLFEEGRKQMNAGHFVEACTAFEGSQKLDPRVTTMLNLAACREQNGQLATAWALYVEAKQMATEGDGKFADVAANHAADLAPRLSRLTIAVAPDHQIAGLNILRGREPVPSASWNRPVPIDGGSYTITARAPGRDPWSTTRTIKPEGDSQTVEIPKLDEPRPVAQRSPTPARDPAEPPAAPAHATEVPAGQPPAGAPSAGPPGEHLSTEGTVSDRPMPYVPIALGGGALVLGGAALYFNHAGDKLHDDAVAQHSQSLLDSANKRRYAAEAFGVAAVGCVGAAIYLYVRSRNETSPTTALAPMISRELTGVAIAGHW